METHGWTRHLRDVRSFEKLTSAGMTFLDVDVIRILDETLPARFGGVPGQYQLVEEERPDGRPRVRLLVHPGRRPPGPGGGAGGLPGRPGVGVGERIDPWPRPGGRRGWWKSSAARP